MSVSATASARESGAATATKARTAPVNNGGAFGDLHPRRRATRTAGDDAVTCSRYSSADFRQDSPVGAGWSFEVAQVTRSTLRGFPPLERSRSGLTYAEDGAYTSPSGELVQAKGRTTPPVSAPDGVFYVPVREREAVRWERLPSTDAWIEHDPSGRKRYYGWDPVRMVAARVVNELGTHAWLLLADQDVNGNRITYDCHDVELQARHDKSAPQRVPVLKSVSWGG